jgi:hypothetical protein
VVEPQLLSLPAAVSHAPTDDPQPTTTTNAKKQDAMSSGKVRRIPTT